ncbi:hypothetical protein [Methylobacterium pseudosasicola]|uniref:Uncharacterized protein n=1 Tax=Methylobacterium pseudosasicola TaxID=582667 RepID=A0A1I4QM48_9HYPH|nr:hypothetical protein [Methylobacterium pseudosasicola]SFM40733.1 hypothetical protein SAMN05192568_103043 [Methylobacterium pseudosasicola]
MRRAIVHIGMPRTGSTSFQEVLARLRPRLEPAGLCYPELAPPGSPPSADVNHHLLGQALDGRRPASARPAALARLAQVLSETRADTVILSYEDFAVQRPSLGVPNTLADLFARHGFAMEVVLVVKPQGEQLASAYALRAQLVAEARTFRAFVHREGRSGRYDYAACLEPWRRSADGRVVAVPVRDRTSDAPLLARLVDALGLGPRLGPLLGPDDLAYRTNRSSGPITVEASRRLHGLGLHRRVAGHPRRLGHLLDDTAWARGLDREPFRGDAPDALAAVEAFHAAANDRLAAACWGIGWDAVVARAPVRPANELAGRAISAEIETEVRGLVETALSRIAFKAPPQWRQRFDSLVERSVDHLADRVGYPAWRVQ